MHIENYPNYPSRRSPVIAQNMVAASQPLAAQAGLQMLKRGGNAIDAALATAITLTLVEPTGCGLGSWCSLCSANGRPLRATTAYGTHGIAGAGGIEYSSRCTYVETSGSPK